MILSKLFIGVEVVSDDVLVRTDIHVDVNIALEKQVRRVWRNSVVGDLSGFFPSNRTVRV